MKRFLTILFVMIIALPAISQTDNGCGNGSVQNLAKKYKLYKTKNMWTFLELETFSGRIWQVQYSVEGDSYRFKTTLNGDSMLPYSDDIGAYAGRFELYSTENMYNFIMLDTETGNTWQVQWSTEYKNRGVLRIW